MSNEKADVYVTQDAYDKVIAYYTKIGTVVRTMGKRTLFSFDGGAEAIIWEVKDRVVSISVTKK